MGPKYDAEEEGFDGDQAHEIDADEEGAQRFYDEMEEEEEAEAA